MLDKFSFCTLAFFMAFPFFYSACGDSSSNSDSEELVKPTTKKSPEAANTWPTVKGTYKESVTEKMISDRIAENEDRWDFNRILREGILG